MGDWVLVIPVKRLSIAKSRLESFAGRHRAALALAFAADTLAAAAATRGVRGVAVVTDEPDIAELARAHGLLVVGDEPDAGLNPALVHGAAIALARWPGAMVAALSSDLPALRPAELALALGLAWAAFYLQSKPADETKTYGYHRASVLAAFINALTLVALSVWILYESVLRLRAPEPVNETIMMAVAGLGLVMNGSIMLALRAASQPTTGPWASSMA